MILKRIFFLILLFTSVTSYAQNMQEVVYLKNGSVIRGVVIEQVPNESLKVQTADGSIFAYKMEEVDKIAKEVPQKQSKSNNKQSSSPSKNKEANDNGSVQFGIRAGMNVSNMKYTDEVHSENYGNNWIFGYHFGFIVDVPLFKNYLYIQPGLFLTSKGCKEKAHYNDGDYFKETVRPAYLEIPILFSGRYTISKTQLQLNFGPYLACGLFNIDKEKGVWNGEAYDKKYTDFYFKRFDAGLSVGMGFLFSRHYYVGFQYEFGLVDMFDDGEDDTLKNKNFMLSIGYNF